MLKINFRRILTPTIIGVESIDYSILTNNQFSASIVDPNKTTNNNLTNFENYNDALNDTLIKNNEENSINENFLGNQIICISCMKIGWVCFFVFHCKFEYFFYDMHDWKVKLKKKQNAKI